MKNFTGVLNLPDLLRQICLNNKDQYEELAKQRAFQHTDCLMSFYKTLLIAGNQQGVTDFKSKYCQGFMEEKQAKMENWVKKYCEFCQQELNGEQQWVEHVKTKKHKSLSKRPVP